MAFALAMQCVHDLPNEMHGRAIFSSTTAIVMLTVRQHTRAVSC